MEIPIQELPYEYTSGYMDNQKARVIREIFYFMVGGDVKQGLLLSQIFYWNLPDDTGKTKLRIERDDCLWLAKTDIDWLHECYLSKDEIVTAKRELQKSGFIITNLWKFNGDPATHYALTKHFLLALSICSDWLRHNELPKTKKEIQIIIDRLKIKKNIPIQKRTYKTSNSDKSRIRNQIASHNIISNSGKSRIRNQVKPELAIGQNQNAYITKTTTNTTTGISKEIYSDSVSAAPQTEFESDLSPSAAPQSLKSDFQDNWQNSCTRDSRRKFSKIIKKESSAAPIKNKHELNPNGRKVVQGAQQRTKPKKSTPIAQHKYTEQDHNAFKIFIGHKNIVNTRVGNSKTYTTIMNSIHALLNPKCENPYNDIEDCNGYLNFKWTISEIDKTLKYYFACNGNKNKKINLGEFIYAPGNPGYNGRKPYPAFSLLVNFHKQMMKEHDYLTDSGKKLLNAMNNANLGAEINTLNNSHFDNVGKNLEKLNARYEFYNSSSSTTYQNGLIDYFCIQYLKNYKMKQPTFKLVFICSASTGKDFIDFAKKNNAIKPKIQGGVRLGQRVG